MAAIPFVTGPVHCWAIVPNTFIDKLRAATAAATVVALSTSPLGGIAAAISALTRVALYLGTAMTAPRIAKRRVYFPIYNDLSGPILPYDKGYAGQEAWIFADLTKWDESVYRTLASAPRPGGFAGADTAGQRGTLMMTEAAGYGLILRYPHYDQHPVFRANGMPAGERYYCAFLEGPDEHEPGNKANARHVAWYSQSVYDPRTGAQVLFDYEVAGIPAIPPS